MTDTFSVRHPSGKVIRFPQGTPDADVASAMQQLDQQSAPAQEPEAEPRPQPFVSGPHSEDFGQRPVRESVNDFLSSVVASSAGQTPPDKALKALGDAR